MAAGAGIKKLKPVKPVRNGDVAMLCAVCQDALFNPHVAPCGHTFCLECIRAYCKKSSKTCPTCNDKITQLAPADDSVRRAVDALEVYCPNRETGCQATFPRRDAEAHMMTCSYVPVKCPNNGCGREIGPSQVRSHMARCNLRTPAERTRRAAEEFQTPAPERSDRSERSSTSSRSETRNRDGHHRSSRSDPSTQQQSQTHHITNTNVTSKTLSRVHATQHLAVPSPTQPHNHGTFGKEAAIDMQVVEAHVDMTSPTTDVVGLQNEVNRIKAEMREWRQKTKQAEERIQKLEEKCEEGEEEILQLQQSNERLRTTAAEQLREIAALNESLQARKVQQENERQRLQAAAMVPARTSATRSISPGQMPPMAFATQTANGSIVWNKLGASNNIYTGGLKSNGSSSSNAASGSGSRQGSKSSRRTADSAQKPRATK